MTKPFYTDGKQTVYNGDCLEIMKTFPDKSFDLVLTDPPYGIGADSSAHSAGGKHGWVDYGDTNWDSTRPSKEYFDEILRVSKHQIIWGGNYFTDFLYPSMGWIVWDKGQREFSLADGELAWTSFWRALRIKTVSRGAALQDGKMHPTQKSLEIIKFCLDYADKCATDPILSVLDPFMGSGTTLVAAKQLNRNATGIEISEKYCQIAKDRLAQDLLF